MHYNSIQNYDIIIVKKILIILRGEKASFSTFTNRKKLGRGQSKWQISQIWVGWNWSIAKLGDPKLAFKLERITLGSQIIAETFQLHNKFSKNVKIIN